MKSPALAEYHICVKATGQTNGKAAGKLRVDFNSPASLEAFRREVEEYTAKATRTEESAKAALTKSGIYTKSGRLTKHYR